MSTHDADYPMLLAALKAARARAGMSQVDLAERLGNAQTFVSKCERGERRLDVVEVVEICEALGVPPLELIADYLEQRGRGLLARDRETKAVVDARRRQERKTAVFVRYNLRLSRCSSVGRAAHS